MALGSYGTALGWLGSETGKSSIRVFFDYNQLCTSKVDLVQYYLVLYLVAVRRACNERTFVAWSSQY